MMTDNEPKKVKVKTFQYLKKNQRFKFQLAPFCLR